VNTGRTIWLIWSLAWAVVWACLLVLEWPRTVCAYAVWFGSGGCPQFKAEGSWVDVAGFGAGALASVALGLLGVPWRR
jgi:hypothetical protein